MRVNTKSSTGRPPLRQSEKHPTVPRALRRRRPHSWITVRQRWLARSLKVASACLCLAVLVLTTRLILLSALRLLSSDPHTGALQHHGSQAADAARDAQQTQANIIPSPSNSAVVSHLTNYKADVNSTSLIFPQWYAHPFDLLFEAVEAVSSPVLVELTTDHAGRSLLPPLLSPLSLQRSEWR